MIHLKGKNVLYIADQQLLNDFVKRSLEKTVLAIDTEFLREKTYYPQLCLLQMATEDEVVLVDPFEVDDLKVLVPLLSQPSLVKIFHAGLQDIEILYQVCGVMPTPVFDTQIAAALLGQVKQIGYAAAVFNECGVSLKKSDSYTDWSRRPLSDSQLSYAADDVIYLPKVYASMKRQLEELGRIDWLTQDFAELCNPARFDRDPYERYKHLKRANALSPHQLSAAREVAAWRELQAQHRNIPRKRVMSDEQIVEACKRKARNLDALFMVRGMRDVLTLAQAREVVRLICKGLDAPADTWPRDKQRSKNEPNVDCVVDLLSALARLRAKEHSIAYQTLVSKDDLVNLARGYYDDCELLSGWRKELVGLDLLALIEGKCSLYVEDGKLALSPRP